QVGGEVDGDEDPAVEGKMARHPRRLRERRQPVAADGDDGREHEEGRLGVAADGGHDHGTAVPVDVAVTVDVGICSAGTWRWRMFSAVRSAAFPSAAVMPSRSCCW